MFFYSKILKLLRYRSRISSWIARRIRRIAAGLAVFCRQSGLLNFVNQRAIADVQHLRGLPPVPLVLSQDLQNDVTFHLPDGLLGDMLQRNPATYRDFDRGDAHDATHL